MAAPHTPVPRPAAPSSPVPGPTAPRSPVPGATAPRSPAARATATHPATLLLRELIDVTDDFERALGDELTVNLTDLTAMQHVISAGALSPTALADRLRLSSAAVTTVIDRLENVGHVSRTPNPDDRRSTLVVAAPDSVRRALGRILPMVADVDDAIRAFDEHEQQVITLYLSRVVEAYRTHAGESDQPRAWNHPDTSDSASPGASPGGLADLPPGTALNPTA